MLRKQDTDKQLVVLLRLEILFFKKALFLPFVKVYHRQYSFLNNSNVINPHFFGR